MIAAAATPELTHEQLRARVAALDCALGLLCISGRDRIAVAEQLPKRQLIAALVYLVRALEQVRRDLSKPPMPELAP